MNKLFLDDEDPERYWGPVPFPENVLLQLARGLSYIHSQGLILHPRPNKAFIWTGTSNNSHGPVYGRVLMKWANCCLYTNDIEISIQEDYWMSPERSKKVHEVRKGESTEETSKSDHLMSDVYEEGLVFSYFLSNGKHHFDEKSRERPQEIEPSINFEGKLTVLFRILILTHILLKH